MVGCQKHKVIISDSPCHSRLENTTVTHFTCNPLPTNAVPMFVPSHHCPRTLDWKPWFCKKVALHDAVRLDLQGHIELLSSPPSPRLCSGDVLRKGQRTWPGCGLLQWQLFWAEGAAGAVQFHRSSDRVVMTVMVGAGVAAMVVAVMVEVYHRLLNC